MSTVIEVSNLYKAYEGVPVLRGVQLQVQEGEAFALIGANGSGKTTLLHLLIGFLRPDRGRIAVLGSSPQRASGRIGYLPERLRYHTRYSAHEYLRFLGRFSDMGELQLRRRIDYLLELVGLSEIAERSLATFSKGMLQRVGVAQALLSDPDLLLFDEPTSGLDPAAQDEVLGILAELRGSGHTILICTHYLHEVERLCDRVGVLVNGQIAVETQIARLQGPAISLAVRVDQLNGDVRRALAPLSPEVQCDERAVIISPNTPDRQAAVLQILLNAGVLILGLDPLETPLQRLVREATSGQVPSLPLVASEPSSAPLVVPTQRGDTLLRELLQRSKERGGQWGDQEEE